MRVRYTPELVAHIRHRYENTDDTLATISKDTGVSERSINRMRDSEGWPRRSDRPARDLPPALRAMQEATALLATRAPAVPPDDDPHPASPKRVEDARERACGSDTLPLSGGGTNDAIARIERLVEK